MGPRPPLRITRLGRVVALLIVCGFIILSTGVIWRVTQRASGLTTPAAVGVATSSPAARQPKAAPAGPLEDRLLAAARDALPTADAAVARAVLAADLALLAVLDEQVTAAEQQLATLLPDSPYAALTSVPGWATVRAGNYGAAVGDPHRWPGPRQIYRASGLSPMQYESAGKRRDGSISREGSVELRRALIDLGLGLWLNDPAAKAYGQALRARGKKGAVIACAMAHRANRIAYAMVRDHASYDPTRWA